jgi:hypothetical protein
MGATDSALLASQFYGYLIPRLYNQSRPHSSLGPGIPEPSGGVPAPLVSGYGIPRGHRVVGIPILGALHHDYRLEKVAA